MTETTAGRLISKLQGERPGAPRLRPARESIISAIRPDQDLRDQHQLKPLWYRDCIELLLQGRGGEMLPVNVELVPSLDCNYECPVCTYRRWKQRTADRKGSRQVGAAGMRLLLDRLEEGGVKGVTVTGGGEPFFNPQTVGGLEYAAARKNFDVGVFTNGSLLSEEAISRISALGLSFIRVSLNTAQQEDYLRFHGICDPRLFERTKQNISLLGKALNGTTTSFGLAIIVNEQNVTSLKTVAEFTRRLFDQERGFKLDYITFRPVVNYGQISPDLSRQIPTAVALQALETFEAVREMLQNYPVAIKTSADYFCAAPQPGVSALSCIANAWCASVAYDGGVYLCSERDGEPDYLMGSLMEQSLAEIWRSAQRKGVLAGISGCPPVCKIQRFNKLLAPLAALTPMDQNERDEMQSFLDLIRAAGEPEKLNFLSF